MKIKEAKIIRYFMFVYAILGRNANNSIREKILNYLQEVYQYEVSDLVKEVLLHDDLSLDNINLLFRRYRYMLLENTKFNEDENKEIEKVVDIYNVAKESIEYLKKLEIIVEDSNISILRSFEILESAMKKNIVPANLIFSIINYLNIYCDKEQEYLEEIAEKTLTKNAMWNDETSILCLIYNYQQKKDYQRAYYWNKIAEGLGYLDNNKYEKLTKANKVLEDNIENDLIIHKLLNDDRASAQYKKEIYEPNLAKILYLGTFDLNEKKSLLFSKGNIDFSEISALVFEEVLMNVVPPKYDFRREEQIRLFEVFMDMIHMDFNVPIIINSESKAIIDIYSNLINQYFEGTTTRDLDASRFDLNNLYRMHALNNYLYQVFTLENTNNVVIKYHNLHEVKENNLSLFFSLLINSNKYFIHDIKVSIDKRNLINIIFCKDISLLDKRIVEASNVITLDKATEAEKKDIIYTKFLIELEKKKLEYIPEYDKLIETINNRIKLDNVCDVVSAVVSRIHYCTIEELEEIIPKISDAKSIGF